MKTRKEVLSQSYLNIHDIQILLKVSYPTARKIYVKASENQKVKFYSNKVLINDVLKVTGISLNALIKQIGE